MTFTVHLLCQAKINFCTSSDVPTRISIGRLARGWTSANQPTNQADSLDSSGIPRRDCNFGNYHYMLRAKPLRHGAARRRGGRDGPAAQLTTSGLFRFRSCLGKQAYNLPPFRRVDIPNFHLDFARDTSPAFKINMALCPKQHLATYDNDKGPEWKYVSE